MAEEEYMDWAVEKRIEMLSEKERMPDQEEALKEMDGLLEGGLKAAERTKAGMFLDRIRWQEAGIYREGLKDGIRIARLVCNI